MGAPGEEGFCLEWRRFPLLVARWFIIGRVFCPDTLEHGGRLFLGSVKEVPKTLHEASYWG